MPERIRGATNTLIGLRAYNRVYSIVQGLGTELSERREGRALVKPKSLEVPTADGTIVFEASKVSGGIRAKNKGDRVRTYRRGPGGSIIEDVSITITPLRRVLKADGGEAAGVLDIFRKNIYQATGESLY